MGPGPAFGASVTRALYQALPGAERVWYRAVVTPQNSGAGSSFVFETLGANDAAIVDTFAVPRYLSWFGDLLLEIVLVGESARVAHLGCRTGYPDLEVVERKYRIVYRIRGSAVEILTVFEGHRALRMSELPEP